MSGCYLVEVKQELITPVTVEADSQQEAIELVLGQQGYTGDTYPGETHIASVRRMDN